MKWQSLVLVALAAAGLAAAQAASGPNGVSRAAVDTPAGPYRLQAGDTIEIRFFFNPELNDTIQIRPDGRVSLQLVGEAEIAGKTVEEAVSSIQTLYAHELKTPKVSLQIRNYAGQKIFVTGEVQRPGAIVLPGDMSVLAAISEAGGIRATGSQNKALLVRKGADGNPIYLALTMRSGGKLAPDCYTNLRAYDVVIIPESHIGRADRWVDQYLKQLNPVNLSAGFSYLYSKTGLIPGVTF